MEKKIIAIVGVLLTFVILGIDAFVIEPNMIDINTINIKDTGNNAKIVFISDFQRRNSDPSFVQRVVSLINEQKPDVVLLGGDYVQMTVDELPSIEPLKKIDTKYGTYGVLGNHDYYDHPFPNIIFAPEIKEFLESDGTINIIQNNIVQIQNMSIVFLDDYWAGLRDETILDEKKQDFRIVLSHNQDGLEIKKDEGDLYLFGHTHCGQVRLPVIGNVPKMMGFEGQYDYRYYFVDGVHVYTTCGLTPAPRFFNPPEITVINLS